MRKIKNDLVFSSFKKSYLLPEIQAIRTGNYISSVYLFNYKRKRNLCAYTLRGRAVLSIIHGSRHKFRSLLMLGRLNGIKKASW